MLFFTSVSSWQKQQWHPPDGSNGILLKELLEYITSHLLQWHSTSQNMK
jgi:hypothetical protein